MIAHWEAMVCHILWLEENVKHLIYILCDFRFSSKKEAQTNVVFTMNDLIWMTNYERMNNKIKHSQKINA
jgi:hypothetical protein